MRIIAGKMKGRKLFPPQGDAIRPTSDRTRESVFNLLMHGQYGGRHIIDQQVVDLCCGTGALGLEAISRGAAECTFIDQDKHAIALARENALHCNVMSQCQFIQADAARLPAARTQAALVLMDAPYTTALTEPAYTALRSGGWLAPDALFVVELPKQNTAPILAGAECIDTRHYGKTSILIYRCA